MGITDAFVGMESEGKFYAVASPLELGNLRKHSRCYRIYSWEALDREARKISHQKEGRTSTAFIVAALLKKLGCRGIVVGRDFPAGLFLKLQKIMPAEIATGALFPERAIKSAYEQKEISKANRGCAAGIALCREYLRRAKIVKGKLVLNNKPLTSEFLRTRVQELFLNMGLRPISDLIITGGKQACDPHCVGHGVLKANELIVVDLFAPLQASHYWGDMTRTFLKGRPTDAQDRLVSTVAFAQREAILAIRSGISGKTIHEGVAELFEISGYRTHKNKNGYEGFFHGTGHALGLDCHDMGPYSNGLNLSAGMLHAGEVLTVEPGLYYPLIGGCRIEDNGVVMKEGFKLLSKAPYDWVV